MNKFTSDLYIAMIRTLEEINISADNELQRIERCYQAIQDTLQQLKDFIVDYTFKDTEEEIAFFKEIKPQFLSELIYYMEVFYIEAGKPVGNKESHTSYYKLAAEHINVFFERNHILYIYYRMRKDDLDGMFFAREPNQKNFQPEYSLDIDPRFSTVNSFKFAKIQAYERLNEYLQQALYMLDHPYTETVTGQKRKQRNLWTDTKAALIELAYAIHSRGSVNNGKGDVKQIISGLELLFNVQVGNFYRTFQSMRIRKKSRTPFLDTLKESLERRMDDTDLGYS